MNADREEQEDELLALHSIFDSEEFVRDESKFAGEIRVCFELPAGFTVTLKESKRAGETLRQYEIASLPPLLLTFELPEDYPSTSPPSFTVTCSWLTHAQLSALSAQLTDLYEASGGTVVLFSWVQFLKEDALGFLDISSLLELPSDEYSTKCDQHSKPGHTDSCNVSDPCKPDLSAPALEVEHLIATLEDDLDPSRTSDSQEAVALTQNTSNDSNRTAQASDHLGEAEETLQKSETKADYQNDLSSAASKSKSLLFSQSDQSGRKDFSNEGNDSAPLLLPSSSSDPLDQSELGAASLPTHPRESPQNEDHTLSGLSLTPSQTLLSQILIYNEAQKQKAFAATVFDCGVCFTGCLGSDCVQLPECRHIFCQTCLTEFCKLQITEGNVRGVTCPEADCTATPTPAQVRRLVGEELFSRYDRLLLQSTLDSMADVVYCPRRSCGSAVIRDKSSNAALCFVCSFAFCVTCRKTYHGTDCQGKKNTKLLEAQQGNADLPQTKEGLKALWDDYASGSKQRRRLLESRYGRSTMQGTLEDSLSENWIITNSKNCPHCFCRIEKNKGCNMMTCTQCGQRFCWACLARLGTGRIGDHFTSNGCSHYEY